MGDTAKNINWNPGDSTIGRTVSGQSGSAFKGGMDWDPRNSTVGQAGQGNFGEAARGAAGGLSNVIGAGKDLTGALLAPAAGVSDLYNSASGVPQAAERRQKDLQGQSDIAFAGRAQADQQAQQQAQQDATNKTNQDYTNQQNAFTQTKNDEDAFTKARNAARVAKGNSLFGAWG